MPWIYMVIIAVLLAAIFYGFDQMNKMMHDIKYLRMKMDKHSS